MIDYKTYIDATKAKLANLLEERKKATNRNERAVQEFFEEHPFSLLGALSGVDSEHQIFSRLIISQPKLKSYDGDRHPDFLIITWNSLNLFFNFIEIEDPSKIFFSSTAQQPSPDFLQAHNQLMQWSSYNKSEVESYCDELLRTLFHENFNNTADKKRHYNFVLLYGFSDELIKLGERHKNIIQEYFTASEKHHCTFSRMLSNFRFNRPLFTVKKDTTANKFKAISFVPFKKYDVSEWSDFHNIIGKQELIRNSTLMTNDEKVSLIKQIDDLDSKTLKEIINLNQASLGCSFFSDLDI